MSLLSGRNRSPHIHLVIGPSSNHPAILKGDRNRVLSSDLFCDFRFPAPPAAGTLVLISGNLVPLSIDAARIRTRVKAFLIPLIYIL
jgi:hypothetical protein